jgi:hypothetical protein
MKTLQYRTFYDWMSNNEETPEKLKEYFKQAKLFLIKKDLFLNIHKKSRAKYNLNPFNPENNNPQKILDFPFKKIFIEPSEDIEMGFKIGQVSFKGFLAEEDVFKDKLIITIFYRIGEQLLSFPYEIKKFLRKETKGLIECNTGKLQYIETLKQLGYNYGEEDIPLDTSILNPEEWNKKQTLDNKEFWKLAQFLSNMLSDFVNIIQFINSINSEIVYIGSTKLDYKKRKNSGEIPISETYTIYLHNQPIKKRGYLFDGEGFSPRYVFDVRGHRRHYRNKKVYRNLYILYEKGKLPKEYNLDGKGFVYRWINPFRRGSGFYVKKQYNITKQEYHKL